MKRIPRLTRRRFLKQSLAAGIACSFVPRHVLGQPGVPSPGETLGAALIGVGGRGPGTYQEMSKSLLAAGLGVTKLAECDVRWLDKADNKTRYADFRRLLERPDIDVVAIATPPHWHAPISIAAMEAGKDVLCEKPMTRFIAEGRAVANAEKRYRRVFQIGTFGRFGASTDPRNVLTRKIMTSGLLKRCDGVVIKRGGHKVKEWSGLVNARPQTVPASLDWDLYCGPSPLKAYHPHRVGGTHRGYWDYEGGGLCDMGQHALDPLLWTWGKDITAPVEAEAFCPPAHHEAVGMWAWAELRYADGFTLVFDSGEWGPAYDRRKPRGVSPDDLSPQDRETLNTLPNPEPLLSFGEAVRKRLRAGGHADASQRVITAIHLMNLAIRLGRKIRFDPVSEQIVGDDFANRLVNPPMRAPWNLSTLG